MTLNQLQEEIPFESLMLTHLENLDILDYENIYDCPDATFEWNIKGLCASKSETCRPDGRFIPCVVPVAEVTQKTSGEDVDTTSLKTLAHTLCLSGAVRIITNHQKVFEKKYIRDLEREGIPAALLPKKVIKISFCLEREKSLFQDLQPWMELNV